MFRTQEAVRYWPFANCSVRELIGGVLIAIASAFIASPAAAHKGSPWHGTDMAAAIGMNTIQLVLPAGASAARFKVTYPTQPNRLDYTVGDTGTVVIVSDDDLKRDGFVSDQNAVLAVENGRYDPSEPLSAEFEIKKTGFYHVLFGPGRATSILVLEPALTVNVAPITAGATVGEFVAPATAGDFHLVKDPTRGIQRFAGWFAVFFEEFQEKYDKLGIASMKTVPLSGQRAENFAKAVTRLGYEGFDKFKTSDQAVTGPFLGHVNGLGVEAVDTVHLTPGSYEFVYSPRQIPSSIVKTSEIVLQVSKDRDLSKGYGTERDIVARREISANEAEFKIAFDVAEAGYYHLAYGPGEGGFIFHLASDDLLPTRVISKSGVASDHAKLTGINSVVTGVRPLESGGTWQVFFPCKLVKAKTEPRGLFKGVQVPLTVDVALSVSRLSAAIMHPIMIQRMRDKLDAQAQEVKRLKLVTQPK